MTERNEILKTGDMLMPSIAYADAAGVPVETKSFNYIHANYGKIDRLIPTTDNLYFEGEWPAGKTSDDTSASADIQRALIKADGFDLPTIGREHIVTFRNTPELEVVRNGIKKKKKIGYGRSTSNSLERQIAGVSPYESGEAGGNGNGIIMKMASLVLWQYARYLSDAQRYREYDQLTTMTHDSDVARIATRVHGDVLFNLLLEEYDADEFGERVCEIADYHEQVFARSNHDVGSNLFDVLYRHEMLVPELKEYYADKTGKMSDEEFGRSYGFYVPETLAISYAAFRIGDGDYQETVYTAVNFGGDADSTASISGAMVNFLRKGEQKMPDDLDKVEGIENLERLSHEFSRTALKGSD